MNRFWATLSSVLLLVTAPGAAGQTRCPIGTQMGSMQCIPDTPEMQGQQAPISEPRGKWTKTWGAIATASSTGEVGTTVGKLSESEARKVAIRQCALGGANDCRINLVYRNQCAALTASQRTGSFFKARQTNELLLILQ
ncbi:DUF4189 domain-containing protein [Xanthomonas euroxanthea]